MANLQNLLPFLQVVKSGSFAAAAARLGVTPPAISKSITRLERELGVRLLQRTTRQMHLTSEGRDFFNKIDALNNGIDDAVEEIKNSVREARGRVRVHAAATWARAALIPLLPEFFRRHPPIQLEIIFDDGPVSLIENGYDIGIGYNVLSTETSLVSRHLCMLPILLLASPMYLAHRGVPCRPEELAQHDCIGTLKPNQLPLQWKIRKLPTMVKKHGRSDAGESRYPAAGKDREDNDYIFTPEARLTVGGQLDVLLQAALAGLGIITMALPMALPFLQSGQLKMVLPDYRMILTPEAPPLEMVVQYPNRKHLPPKTQALVSFLVEHSHAFEEPPSGLRAFSASLA